MHLRFVESSVDQNAAAKIQLDNHGILKVTAFGTSHSFKSQHKKSEHNTDTKYIQKSYSVD